MSQWQFLSVKYQLDDNVRKIGVTGRADGALVTMGTAQIKGICQL